MIRFFNYLKPLVFFIFFTNCVNEYNQQINFQLPDNIYTISHYENSNLLQIKYSINDSSYSVIQKSSFPNEKPLWKISPFNNNTYKIQSLSNNGKFLGVSIKPSPNENESLILQDWQESDSQLWIIQKYKDEKFKIINKMTHKCLYIEYIQADESTVQLKKCSNNPREFWKIELH